MKKYFEMSDESLTYLKDKDPLMKKLIETFGELKREVEEDPFTALISSIVYQQLAYKAANSIWNKFMGRIGTLTPSNLLKMSYEELRACGLSNSKVNYVQNIAEKFTTGYELIDWNSLTNEEVIEKLTIIKGVGKWTAEMFLIFCLQREDICTYTDLGLKYGLRKLYGLNDISEEVFSKITNNYTPYKTIASFYLWELISNKNVNIDLNIDYSIINSEKGIGFLYSKISWIRVATNKDKITEVDFVQYPDFSQMLVTSTTKKAIDELIEYFSHARTKFSLDLEISGTEFQVKVWNELLKIPYGETISYQELAIRIGDIKSTRAVGMANNKNKIGIIIPCHRVIGKNGSLTGYAGGVGLKEGLLKHEKDNTIINKNIN